MSGWMVAGFWGLIGGLALLVGALIGLYARVSQRVVSGVMAIGAGVLISSVAFELMDEAFRSGGFDASAFGLLAGSVVYWGGDAALSRKAKHRKRSQGQQEDSSGTALLLGALLDGIPESLAIGISLVAGGGVSWAMVGAVFLSNIPESLSASSGMKKSGKSTGYILGVWSGVVVVSSIAAALGYALLGGAGGNTIAFIQSFAAGAVLTMLASTMMPEAYEEGGHVVGILTTLGFLAAFVLSRLEK